MRAVSRCQVFRVATIGIFLTLNTITPIKSSKQDKPPVFVKKHKTIQSFLDSKAAENGRYKSYLSPDQSREGSNTDFSRLQEDVDEHMQGFNFDQSDFDKINVPQRHSTQPKFVLNYEPLRPSNYLSRPSTHYNHYPFGAPEHQDDGGDSDGFDIGDDSDGGGGVGNDGGGGGGGGINRGGGGGNRGGDNGDGDDGRFLENVDAYGDNYEHHNDWNPVRNNYKTNVPNNYFKIPKNIGYNANRLSKGTSNNYQKPYKPRMMHTKKQSQRFSDDPYSRKSGKNKRPYKVYEEESQQVFQERGNGRRPSKKIRKKEQSSPYDDDDFGPSSSILDGDIEEEEDDDHSPLQSRPLPTKKRQVCHKISKSMTPNDIEDHDVIGRKMSCMVCKNFASGGTFEKCSYKSSPLTDNYFKEPDEVSKPKYKSRRYKRRAVNKRRKVPESGEEIDDYYESTNLDESEEDPDAVVEYNKGDPENYETAENESAEYAMPSIPTESATCHKVKKGGNICNVCRDNLSNRQFEQCEYEIEPEQNAYEYSTRNVYGPRHKRQLDSDRTYDDYFKKLFPELGSSRKSSIATKFSSKDGDFGLLDSGKIGFKKSRPSLLGDKDLSIDFDSLEESPVNRMLGEFQSKDRSNCQKSLKDKMTCYKCKNDKGAETEECMYITDGKPNDRKQSYHETKKFNSNPDSSENDNKPILKNSTQQSASSSLAHIYAPLYSSKYEPIGQHSHIYPNRRRNYRLHRGPIYEEPESVEEEANDADQAEAQSVEDYDYLEDPSTRPVSRHDLPEIDPFGPDGAYSEETVPVYDASLGTWLPRYMVVKSSQEEMVDEELGLY